MKTFHEFVDQKRLDEGILDGLFGNSPQFSDPVVAKAVKEEPRLMKVYSVLVKKLGDKEKAMQLFSQTIKNLGTAGGFYRLHQFVTTGAEIPGYKVGGSAQANYGDQNLRSYVPGRGRIQGS